MSYGWPLHIMAEAGGVPDLTDDERGALDENVSDDLETLLHIRNAYMYVIVTAMCDDHEVSHLLEGVPEGRARQALDCIRNYVYPNSTSGRRMAYKTFVTSSMASTGNTIVEWSATVRRNASYLRQNGGEADESAQLSVFLEGLLAEFSEIKLILDETDNLSEPSKNSRTARAAKTSWTSPKERVQPDQAPKFSWRRRGLGRRLPRRADYG